MLCLVGSFIIPPHPSPPTQTVFAGGGVGVYYFQVRPLVRPSIHNVLVFQYLEKEMAEFHKIWQTHWYPQDEHL